MTESSAAEPATLFTGGTVFDGAGHLGRAEVLVEGGRVTAVGTDLPRSGARVVDLAGGLLAPGFTDAHVHPVQGGLGAAAL